MDELTREFLIESQEGLDRMERCLTDLEKRPKDAALIAEIFRSVHTIKGTTGFLGYKRLEKLAHVGENLLGQLRDGKMLASAPVVTVLLQLLDTLRSILRAIEADDSEGAGDDAGLIERLEKLQSAAVGKAADAEPVKAAVPASVRMRSRAPGLASAKRTKRAADAPAAAVFSAHPDASSVAPPETQSSVEEQERPKTTTLGAAESTLRVDVTLLNRMMNLVGELVLTRNQVLQATASVPV